MAIDNLLINIIEPIYKENMRRQEILNWFTLIGMRMSNQNKIVTNNNGDIDLEMMLSPTLAVARLLDACYFEVFEKLTRVFSKLHSKS